VTGVLVAGGAILGLMIGSFLNVIIYRVPLGKSIVRPPSACPDCQNPIRPRDNIPVLSWLILRGRCRDCGEPIAIRYPLVEVGTAGAFAGVTLVLGASWTLPAYWVATATAPIDIDAGTQHRRCIGLRYCLCGTRTHSDIAAANVDHPWSRIAGTKSCCGRHF